MPGGNGTGPMGAGPMTGRGAGCCAGFDKPGFANFGGRGMGMGRGMRMGRGGGFGRGGFGFGNRFYGAQQAPAMSAEQEKEYVRNDIKALEEELEAAKKRIKEL